MSAGKVSSCPKCEKDPRDPPVMVVDRNCNYSAFNGYAWTGSDYSMVMCLWCGSHWRTKAKYVDEKPDAPKGWVNMKPEEWRKAVRRSA